MPADDGLVMISVTFLGLAAVRDDGVKRSWPPPSALSLRTSPPPLGWVLAVELPDDDDEDALPELVPPDAATTITTATTTTTPTTARMDMRRLMCCLLPATVNDALTVAPARYRPPVDIGRDTCVAAARAGARQSLACDAGRRSRRRWRRSPPWGSWRSSPWRPSRGWRSATSPTTRRSARPG